MKLNQLVNTGTDSAAISEPETHVPSQSEPNILDSLKLNQALRLAEKVAKEGDAEEAKRIYQNILAKFPKNKKAQQGLANLNKPKHPTATQGPPQDTINQLLNLYNQGQLAAVVDHAQVLIKEYPEAIRSLEYSRSCCCTNWTNRASRCCVRKSYSHPAR